MSSLNEDFFGRHEKNIDVRLGKKCHGGHGKSFDGRHGFFLSTAVMNIFHDGRQNNLHDGRQKLFHEGCQNFSMTADEKRIP